MQVLDTYVSVVLGSRDVVPRSINNAYLSTGEIHFKGNRRNGMGEVGLSSRFTSNLLCDFF